MREEQWKLRRCDSFELDHLMSVSQQFPGVSLFTATSRVCQPVFGVYVPVSGTLGVLTLTVALN